MADPPHSEDRTSDTEFETPVESARGGMPRIGDVVAGRYKVERILGSGGMGVVVEARHTALGELVAIKFLRADARKDPAMGERFLREAKASSQLKGEHVARVHDLGTTEAGHAYLVMEHLSGTDLAALIADRGALAVGEGVDYLLQACEGLAEAHAHGIVHRDLKPSNLFLTRTSDGAALIKLLDFGIAKATTEAPNAVVLTETHAVFGSPAYMSPEQIRSAKNVDVRTDIWSLGVVLFELLSATLPFQGESSPAVLAAVAADKPTSLKSLRPEVPQELSDLVARCLEKDPARRVQSVLELAVGLLPFAAGLSTISVERIRRMSLVPRSDSNPSFKPLSGSALTGRAWATTSPAPSTAPQETKKKKKNNNKMGSAIAAVALAAIVSLGYVGLRTRETQSANPSATQALPPLLAAASSAPEPAIAPSPPASVAVTVRAAASGADAGVALAPAASSGRSKIKPRPRPNIGGVKPTPTAGASASPGPSTAATADWK